MRVFLCDLNWESDFYKAVNGNGKLPKPGTIRPDYELPESKRSRRQGSGSLVDSGDLPSVAYDVGRAVEACALFIQVTASDFATLFADGVWTQQELPGVADDIIKPYQELLNQVDPGPG